VQENRGGQSVTITVKRVTGPELAPYIEDLAYLRIKVFRDFPYLYDGTLEYEERYLKTYLQSPRSIAVLALDGSRVVGASTGLPMTDETPDFQAPFLKSPFDVRKIFYCGESVLLAEYRGRGLYREFFKGREEHAVSLGCTLATFCAVERPEDHPLRPQNYTPPDRIWNHFGYERKDEIRTMYRWKDIDQDSETEKPMVFWIKRLPGPE
jgi:GNAT superfamily N-acetyltransferase